MVSSSDQQNMGGGNAKNSNMALDRNLEKQKAGSEGTQLDSNNTAMNIQLNVQSSNMGPDTEMVAESRTGMEVVGGEGNSSVCDSKDVLMQCASNCEDISFHVQNLHDDRAKVHYGNEDVEVDIVDCTKPIDCRQAQALSEDETESMSSFGDTDSEHENGSEVDSKFYFGGAPTSIFDGCGAAFGLRKKKLTDHWRRFIRPIMWRSKWLELQIMELQSQTHKYDRELALCKQRKQLDSEVADGFHAKSLPFSSCDRRKKIMKRKKRKRFEETVDIASYILQHNLFSYYENKKSAADGPCTNDDCNNPGKMNNDNTEVGFQNGLASLESMTNDDTHEEVFRKIEVLQSRVRRLKAQIDNVIADNPVEFSTVSDVSLPNTLSHLKSEFDTVDVKPQNVVSSQEEVADRIVVREGAAKETPPPSTGKDAGHVTDSPAEMPVARPRYSGKSLPKSRSSVQTKTRKRGRRKSGTRRWGRRS